MKGSDRCWIIDKVVPLPGAPIKCGVGVLFGKIYCVGGWVGAATARVQQYDPALDRGAHGDSLNKARHGCGVGKQRPVISGLLPSVVILHGWRLMTDAQTPISFGTHPVSWFPSTDMCVSSARSPSAAGIVPVSWL